MRLTVASPVHIPVLLREVLESLKVQAGGRYIDGTVGGGGHAAAILERSLPGGQLLGIDADPMAITTARQRLQAYADSVLLVHENFSNLEATCTRYGFRPVHGILFDLGLSSLQLEDTARGFSFQHDAPLDMRFNPHQKITAADILNTLAEEDLAHLLRSYSEEPHSHLIARYIVQQRPLHTTAQLVRVIEQAVGGRRGRIHPATRVFQALRIAVNRELEHLESALKQAVNLLGLEGRLAVISYHSLEDRIVKQFLHRESRDCICPPEIPACVCHHRASLRIISKKVITPSLEEVQFNPRSRSARLRVAERRVRADERYGSIELPNFSTWDEGRGWRRPVLMEKIRRTFLAVQLAHSKTMVRGVAKM